MLRTLVGAMAAYPKRVPIPRNGVDYRGKVVLAPMVRSGELPSRLLALKYGADLVWGPETVAQSMIGTTKRYNPVTSTIDYTRLSSNGGRVDAAKRESLIYRLHPTRERGKLIFQIGTASPTTAVAAAKLVAEEVAGIDVNAGCPKPFSTSGGMGAALLQTPDLLASILTALVKEVGNVHEIGISVKIRLLETSEKTEALVKKLCSTGITGLTVHCRTTPMRPRERALRDERLHAIARICKEEGVACLMNGDVKNRDEAVQLAKAFNVDGAMIATAAESNPSCFRTRSDGGLLPWRDIVSEYLKTALEVENRWGNTKFLLSQLMPGKSDVYRRVASCHGYRQVCEILGLDNIQALATDVDKRIGTNEEKETKAMKKAKHNQNHKRQNSQERESETVKKAKYFGNGKAPEPCGKPKAEQMIIEQSYPSPSSNQDIPSVLAIQAMAV